MARNVLNQKGFSMVELLVTVALFSLISMGMMAVFSQAIRIWKITQRFSSLDVDLSLERMKDDLRNTARYGNEFFQGDKESFYLMRSEVLLDKKVQDLDLPAQVKYTLDRNSHEISRELVPWSAVLKGEKNNVNHVKKMGAHIEQMKFRYYAFDPQVKGYRFVEQWKSQSCAPQAIEVTLTYGKMQKFETMTRMLEIPIGGCRV